LANGRLPRQKPAVHNLKKTYTDRLVPVEFLARPGFLTRNLGGWSPIYFGVAHLPASLPPDPLLDHMAVLADYGEAVRFFGADAVQVADRMELESGCDWSTFYASLLYLHSLRPQPNTIEEAITAKTAYIKRLFDETVSGNCLATNDLPPIPKILLYDELLGQMQQLELTRRNYLMDGKIWHALTIQSWQEAWQKESGMTMIVKGEYIAGRHRGSLVLIAPELGVVVKQPAPEPFHEIELESKTVAGKTENWPILTRDALVTPRGRVRLLLEEGFIPRLHQIFKHDMIFSTLMGFTLEEFVVGQTVQEYILADHQRMTPELYDNFLLHQQTCELLGVENGDWHAANFILRDRDGEIVHIDWGAARPLRRDELTQAGFQRRLNQVQNIGFSFHNEELAQRVKNLHTDLVADSERLERIRRRAQAVVEATGN